MTVHPTDCTDHSAVMAVIIRETEMFLQADFSGWAECWVQDTRTREVCVSSAFGATVLEGWDQLSAYIGDVMARGAVCDVSDMRRENIFMTVAGDLAHVVFDELSQTSSGRIESTYETRVLERADGRWRILYASFVLRGHQYADENRLAVDGDGKVMCAPEEARAHLKEQGVLHISRDRLRAAKPAWDKLLQEGLKRAADQHGFFEHYRYMREAGRSFRLPIVFGENDEGGVAVCVLFVRDGRTFVETQNDGDIDARLSIAQTVFGLSEAQMQLAQRIVSGDNLTAAAEALDITVNTVRTHLSRIYVKTGVNSQTALVRTLLSVG